MVNIMFIGQLSKKTYNYNWLFVHFTDDLEIMEIVKFALSLDPKEIWDTTTQSRALGLSGRGKGKNWD